MEASLQNSRSVIRNSDDTVAYSATRVSTKWQISTSVSSACRLWPCRPIRDAQSRPQPRHTKVSMLAGGWTVFRLSLFSLWRLEWHVRHQRTQYVAVAHQVLRHAVAHQVLRHAVAHQVLRHTLAYQVLRHAVAHQVLRHTRYKIQEALFNVGW